MADKTTEVLVPTVTPGSPDIEEVKRDAERITIRRLREAEEERAYQEEKKQDKAKVSK